MQVGTDRMRSLIGDAAFAALCCRERLNIADMPAALENYEVLSRALIGLHATFDGDLSDIERRRLETFLPVLRAECSWLGARIMANDVTMRLAGRRSDPALDWASVGRRW